MMCPRTSWRSTMFASSDSFSGETGERRRDLRNASHIINVIAQRDEQVEEQLRTTCHHFHLHGATALESSSAADNECEVVGSQLRVGVRCIGVSVAGGGEDCAALDAGFYCCFRVRLRFILLNLAGFD